MIRLFELRSEKEMSQRDVAKVMNVSQGTYNNWENSNTQPSIEQLISLAKFFDVSVDYLIGNSDNYGTEKDIILTGNQRKILMLLYNADPKVQEAIIDILSATIKEND